MDVSQDITGGGERITPDLPNWGYFAHLSIYSFCARFAKGARVLDAGCGTGYGCDHLIRHGAASVLGVDFSEKAIEFCRARYSQPRLSFKVMDLCRSTPNAAGKFDIIFCNIAEHLPDVEAFLDFCRLSLCTRGLLLLTVPAIASPGILEGNLKNPYHITNLVPQAWLAKVGRYFQAVQGFRHWVGPEWLADNGLPSGMDSPPQQTLIRETDFEFTALSAEALNSEPFNISLVMLACVPRLEIRPARPDEDAFPPEWDIVGIYQRARRQKPWLPQI